MPASVSILMRQLPAMRLICIALMSVIFTLFRSAATSGLKRVNTPVMGKAMARQNISRRVKVVITIGYNRAGCGTATSPFFNGMIDRALEEGTSENTAGD